MSKARSFLSRSAAVTLLLFLGALSSAHAQLCTGSFGDPVINITFGSGSNPGPGLKAAATGYQYTSNSCPADGEYTVTNSTVNCFGSTWHSITSDHTGKPGGYFMLINASFNPSDFYLDTVKGLCSNTTYRFAAWITNILVSGACDGSGIQPNITFSIESRDGTVLQQTKTGNIPTSSSTSWRQYSLDFTIPAGITDIVLRMTNNAPGGCGNDLALDDITFSPCGPRAEAGIAASNGSNATAFCIYAQTPLGFTGAVSPGYSSPSYQWQVSTDTGSTWSDIPGETNLTYTRMPTAAAGLYQYRMAVGDGGNVLLPTCRVASNVISITVYPKPIPAATSNSPVCEGTTATLNASDGTQFDWTGPGGYTATGQNPSIQSITAAQSGIYYVTVTNAGGCTQTDQTTITVYPSPVPAFNIATPPCEKTLLSFADQSLAGGQTIQQWRWDFGDGGIDSILNPVHTYTSAGRYNVALVVTSDKGCSSQPYTRNITVNDLPFVSFGLPEVCLADPVAQFKYTDSSHIADGTEAAFSWSWDFGDPDANAGNPNTSAQKDPIHKYQSSGPFNIRLSVTSGNGCVKDSTRIFTVNGSNPRPGYAIAPPLLCINEPILLTDNSSVAPGSIVRTEIYWDYQNDPTIHLVDDQPAPGKEYTHSYPYFNSPAVQTFQLHYIVYSGQTCMNEKVQTVTINASPQTAFDALTPVCEEIAPYLITAGHETQNFTGVGTYSGRGIAEDGTFTPRIAGPGPDTLIYTFTGANGCADTSQQTILVYPQPQADAGPTEYFLEGGILRLEGSGSGNGISYSWSPADSILDDPNIPHPQVSPHEDIVYTLKVTSADGCTASSSVQVIVLKIPVVPNAFSPNGDGINDTWIIRYLDEYPGADVQVFNRYGQPVFHAIGYTKPWDGTLNGRPLPVGTYYWIINPKNGRKQISGSVTILR